jgi:thiol-disulfide isomerase/thioredoxin
MMRVILSMMLLAIGTSLSGQDFKNELKVGDRLPMAELKNMINYPSKTLKFADHKPKLTILDFWGTTCAGCVLSWPKMLALQKEFGDDLQIILVDRSEDEKFVKDFITNRKKTVGVDMNLPVSCKDTTLKKFFPRRGVPRYSWIDSNGVLASATHGDQVTSKNIRKWIETGPFQMDQIIEEMMWLDGNKPIFVDGNGGTGRADAFIWSSSLTRSFRDLVGDTQDFTSSFTGYGIRSAGSSIANLYSKAYNNRLKSTDDLTWLHGSRVEVIAQDTSKYYGWYEGAKSYKARYNYQLIAGRPMTRQQLQGVMQEDLQRYFGLSATWEKKKKPCLVFTMFDSTKATGKARYEYGSIVGETQTFLDNVRMHEVIFDMEQGSYFYDRRPIVDETGFNGLLSGINFEVYYKDIKAMDKAFSKFGIHLKEEIREVDILVLREPGLSN